VSVSAIEHLDFENIFGFGKKNPAFAQFLQFLQFLQFYFHF
jgi:hypothetical protein